MNASQYLERLSPAARNRVRLMKEVIGGVTANITPVQFLNTHKLCDGMLAWLIKNNLTGLRFSTWFLGDMKGSFLEMAAELSKRVQRDDAVKTPMRKDFA